MSWPEQHKIRNVPISSAGIFDDVASSKLQSFVAVGGKIGCDVVFFFCGVTEAENVIVISRSVSYKNIPRSTVQAF
jgi:hypothetical protein